MNVKEYAEEKGISLTEAKELTGLTHWKQEVPDTEPVVDTESKEEDVKPVLKNEKKVKEIQFKATQLRQYLGEKDHKYLEFVSAYRDIIPAEYNRAKEMISIYL